MNLSFITTMAGHAWGGSEELWVKLAHDALIDGHQVECSVFNWGQLPPKIQALQVAGVAVQKRSRFIYPELHKKPWGKIIERTIAAKQLSKHLANKDFALISMGGFCDLEVDAFRKPLLSAKAPFSIVVHVNPDDYYLNTHKISEIIKVCQKAHKVYFVSNRLKEIAIRQTGYSFPNGELIINPVNMSEVGVLPYPKTDTLQMACVGRLDAKVKGQAIALQCLADMQWKQRDWHLNIYGTGQDLNYFKLLCKNFGIENRVSFHGFTNDIRKDIWANNHLLLMPSYFEGLPIALVEAMLCGRTAVATDVGGNAEILKDNETGFIAMAANKGAFSEALERAWQQNHQWKEMGENAYSSCYRFFYDSGHPKHINDILPK
ncbi:glycosyltransferase [Carboxylicivirga sp. A043]|uniref:glycosyltransferase n=1 Tax=Carboxylicivirga litoralis TaxID=2816963 RepID=UPI0021CB3AD4|nr:glycosyltransferase [Carboxylicivirga sp. A043]MCU4158052.1 glycosyltransferase [Carboxylicivirga sp. A043]